MPRPKGHADDPFPYLDKGKDRVCVIISPSGKRDLNHMAKTKGKTLEYKVRYPDNSTAWRKAELIVPNWD